jgi:dTDP-glucose 4,6-dehydratase
MGTMLCQGFAKQFGKQIVIIRPSSIYGKYERPEKFIPTVIRKLVNFEQIDVYRGFHDWLHVDDFIEAIFTILEDGDVKGDIYNVSSGIDWSNAEITSMIQAVGGGGTLNDNIVIHDYYFHPHDTERWVVDNSKLIKLGWKPQYNILSGLEKTVIDIMDTMT